MKANFLIALFFPILLFSQSSSKKRIDFLITQVYSYDSYQKLGERKMLELCDELYTISKDSDDKKGMLIALTNRLIIYSNNSNTKLALKNISEALPLAEELKKYEYYSLILDARGRVLAQLGNFDDARESFSKAFKALDNVTDKDSLYFRKALIYTSLEDYALRLNDNPVYKDSTLHFAQKSYAEIQKVSDKNNMKNVVLGQSMRLLGYAYDNINNQKKADEYYDKAEIVILKESDKRLIVGLYAARGNLEFARGNDEKALKYWEKTIQFSKGTYFILPLQAIYPKMIEYYKKINDSKMQAYYLEKSKSLNDSLALIDKSALISQNKTEKKTATEQKNSIPLVFYLIAIALLLIFIVIYFYRRNLAMRNLPTEQNPIIIKPESELQENNIDENKLSLLYEMAKRDDKQFLIVFQEIFPELYQKLLMLPDLTPSDLEMCAYLKLNIQTKEIATYKRCSVNSVDSRKYRLRKKIHVPVSINLYLWINKL